MILRIKSSFFMGRKRPLYRVFASSRHKYKVARAGLKHPKEKDKFWYPKYAFETR